MPPDFNADKELGQGKRKWVVQNANKRLIKEIKTGKGVLKTDDLGRCTVNDPALAAEIRNEHRRDLVVSRIFTDHPADRGHHYVFGQWPEMPWKKDKEQDDGHRVQESPGPVSSSREPHPDEQPGDGDGDNCTSGSGPGLHADPDTERPLHPGRDDTDND